MFVYIVMVAWITFQSLFWIAADILCFPHTGQAWRFPALRLKDIIFICFEKTFDYMITQRCCNLLKMPIIASRFTLWMKKFFHSAKLVQIFGDFSSSHFIAWMFSLKHLILTSSLLKGQFWLYFLFFLRSGGYHDLHLLMTANLMPDKEMKLFYHWQKLPK